MCNYGIKSMTLLFNKKLSFGNFISKLKFLAGGNVSIWIDSKSW